MLVGDTQSCGRFHFGLVEFAPNASDHNLKNALKLIRRNGERLSLVGFVDA
jgi:hypothetical protein